MNHQGQVLKAGCSWSRIIPDGGDIGSFEKGLYCLPPQGFS